MKISKTIPSIHKEGYIFIIIAVAFTALVASKIPTLGWISAIITLWIVYFFRDPERVSPEGNNLVISPADGVVQKIETALPPEELNMKEQEMTRISVFLNIFNVHVNRVPASGTITKVHYKEGKFFNAALDKASTHNERQSCLLKTTNGAEIAFCQIAGLIAKRIVCDLDNNQKVTAGERFGIIRFGSRMDIYLPKETKISIKEGQIAIGGETILAELKAAPVKKTVTSKTTTATKTVATSKAKSTKTSAATKTAAKATPKKAPAKAKTTKVAPKK